MKEWDMGERTTVSLLNGKQHVMQELHLAIVVSELFTSCCFGEFPVTKNHRCEACIGNDRQGPPYLLEQFLNAQQHNLRMTYTILYLVAAVIRY